LPCGEEHPKDEDKKTLTNIIARVFNLHPKSSQMISFLGDPLELSNEQPHLLDHFIGKLYVSPMRTSINIVTRIIWIIGL
jgi:hypothetical protein